MTDIDIINEFSDKNGKINPNKTRINWLNHHLDIKLYLEKRYPNDDFISYLFVLKRIFNHIEYLPLCKNCGKKLYNINGKWCNTKCQLSDKNFIQYKKEKLNYKEIGQKISNTKINWDDEKKKKVLLKRKSTNLKRYGNEIPIYNQEIKEKIKQTNLIKYGVDNVFKSNLIKEKIKNIFIQKYGVDNPMKCKEISYKIANSEIRKQHEYEAKKKNGTFNSSKLEDISYILLKEKYPDVIRQYKSELYPFNCDFYIPLLDLYIECQYGQFHRHRPYLGTKEDLKDIEILKEKAEQKHKETGKIKSRYDNELETWTIRDVKKRNIAKKNNLNYIEFWNIKELKEWILWK